MEINRAYRLGEIQTPIAISTYLTKLNLFLVYFLLLFHGA
jgi:hypothetical protein